MFVSNTSVGSVALFVSSTSVRLFDRVTKTHLLQCWAETPRLVYAHDHGLEALEAAAMAFIEENALLFHREAMPTLSVLAQRPHHLLLAVTGLLMAGVVPGCLLYTSDAADE